MIRKKTVVILICILLILSCGGCLTREQPPKGGESMQDDAAGKAAAQPESSAAMEPESSTSRQIQETESVLPESATRPTLEREPVYCPEELEPRGVYVEDGEIVRRNYASNAGIFFRNLPWTVKLEDGREMEFVYDDGLRLSRILIDGEVDTEFEWQYDVYTGRSTLLAVQKGDVCIEYTEKTVLIDSLYGKSRCILESVTFIDPQVGSRRGAQRSYRFIINEENNGRIEGLIHNGDKVADIVYTENRPEIVFTPLGEETLTQENRDEILKNCRFLDGAVYIAEMNAYYYPDRGFVNAATGTVISSNIEEVNRKAMENKVVAVDDKGAEWGKNNRLIRCTLPSGSLLELDYIGTDYVYTVPILIEKRIDGETVTEYYWKRMEDGRVLLDRIINNGVEVKYLQWERYASRSYYQADLYGFIYDGEIYVYGESGNIGIDEGEEISVYHDGREVACYDSTGKLIRGEDFPKDVEILIRGPKEGAFYIEELDAYSRGGRLFYWDGEETEYLTKESFRMKGEE